MVCGDWCLAKLPTPATVEVGEVTAHTRAWTSVDAETTYERYEDHAGRILYIDPSNEDAFIRTTLTTPLRR